MLTSILLEELADDEDTSCTMQVMLTHFGPAETICFTSPADLFIGLEVMALLSELGAASRKLQDCHTLRMERKSSIVTGMKLG